MAAGGWWQQPCYDRGDEAVYKRLEHEGWKPLSHLFERVSQLLAHWLEPTLQAYHQRHGKLAPFATEVVALDEMHLDQVKKHVPILRQCTKGARALLPGKLIALFERRLQHWRAIEYLEQAAQNGREQAKALLRSLTPGALVLADLGYFGFEWFDDLTERGYSWISRVKHRTTVVVVHTYSEAGETFDRLVWLGAWNTHGKYVVRHVQYRQGGQLRPYVTNVCNPTVLSFAAIARLSARRWEIERAFLTRKRERGLHLIWRSKQVVMLAQVWACLIIAHVLQAIRMEVALRADVDAFDVSLPLLIQAFPPFDVQGRDGIAECLRQGRRLGIIGPSTRLRVEAPEILHEQLIPMPKETKLCRPPSSTRHSQKENQRIQPLGVHPQRDQRVAILMQREADIKRARRERGKPALSPQRLPTPPHEKRGKGSVRLDARRPFPPVQPDDSVLHPSWPFLQPFIAQTESERPKNTRRKKRGSELVHEPCTTSSFPMPENERRPNPVDGSRNRGPSVQGVLLSLKRFSFWRRHKGSC